MPMPNNDFQWRPNDNSATTNLRYTLEAQKWVNAVSSAQRKSSPRSISGDIAFIGMLLELVFSVALLILLGVLQLITALVRFVETGLNTAGNGKDKTGISYKNIYDEGRKPDAVWDMQEPEKYPTGLQLIFYTSYGTLRTIWKFLFLLVSIFIILVLTLYLLSQWIPNHFIISKGTLIFAAGVSLWNAFLGVDD